MKKMSERDVLTYGPSIITIMDLIHIVETHLETKSLPVELQAITKMQKWHASDKGRLRIMTH